MDDFNQWFSDTGGCCSQLDDVGKLVTVVRNSTNDSECCKEFDDDVDCCKEFGDGGECCKEFGDGGEGCNLGFQEKSIAVSMSGKLL